jgi:hypothetical protein
MQIATCIAVIILGVSAGRAEWLWVCPSPAEQTPILSYTTYGYRHSDPASAQLAVLANQRLRITDVRVHAISKSHVALVSSETRDVILLPLKKAAADFQIRGRTGSALQEAIALKGERADDDFSANAWLIAGGARAPDYLSSREKRVAVSSSAPVPRSGGAPISPSAHVSDVEAPDFMEQHAIEQRRRSYDMQKESARFQEDNTRRHKRVVDDMRHGHDSQVAHDRWLTDARVDQERRNHDSEVERKRRMNDAARQSGGMPAAHEPMFYSPSFP